MKIIEYQPDLEAAPCLKIIENDGALLLRNYVPTAQRAAALVELPLAIMRTVDERTHKIAQEFETLNYRYPGEASPQVHKLGQRIVSFASARLPEWQPNDVAIQRYLPSHLGIENHRDYASDILLVAVASLEGRARFHIETDEPAGKQWNAIEVIPGDLVLLRAPGLSGSLEDRPYHRIEAPLNGQRISVAYRHNTKFEVHYD